MASHLDVLKGRTMLTRDNLQISLSLVLRSFSVYTSTAPFPGGEKELSPEQICDHIDDDANYEDLLKVCVNRYLKVSRKFEAAKMLARPASQGTRVFETNRNDKQLAYLVSLYQDEGKILHTRCKVD